MILLAFAVAIAISPACVVDTAAMLALPSRQFDQTEGQGWRLVAAKGCDAAVADLIAAYRAANLGDPLAATMIWHEGQMRANAGDYAAARPLFAAARLTRSPFNWFGWNDYVAATIAFLDRDRPALLAARARLAATPRPKTHAWTDPNGTPIAPPTLATGEQWPANLPVVDALVRCFDRSYKAAYGSADCYASNGGS